MSTNSEKRSQARAYSDRMAANIIASIMMVLAILSIIIGNAAVNESKLSSHSTERVIELLEEIESNTRHPAIQPAPSHKAIKDGPLLR